MKDKKLKLFVVEFSHRLYKTQSDKVCKLHFWQYLSLMICCNDISDTRKEISEIVDNIYKGFTFSVGSSKSYQCSSEINIISTKEIQLPTEVNHGQ